jgi:hypothetical protein
MIRRTHDCQQSFLSLISIFKTLMIPIISTSNHHITKGWNRVKSLSIGHSRRLLFNVPPREILTIPAKAIIVNS